MPPTPHSVNPSAAASDLARRLFERELQSDTPADTAEAAQRICSVLTGGLARWFGPYGSQALVVRALNSAQAAHPVLKGVSLTDAGTVIGLAENAAVHGGPAAVEGVITMVAALADLIGRLIGHDLAGSLLEQSTTTWSPMNRAAPNLIASDDAPQTVKP